MAAILEQIVSAARARMSRPPSQAQIAELERMASEHRPRGFADGLRRAAQSGPAVIAELKKASPSRGLIRANFQPPLLARELAQAGAAAVR